TRMWPWAFPRRRSSAHLREEGADLVEGHHAMRVAGGESGLRHGWAFGGSRLLHDRYAAPPPDAGQPGRAIVAGTSEDDAHGVLAVGIGNGLEQHVDGRAAEADVVVGRERHAPPLDEKVIAGRRQIGVAR